MEVDNRSKTMQLGQVFATYPAALRKTKIICTLGPACWETEMLVKMIDAGMNIARFNFSHGDHKTHGACLERLRAAMAQRPNHHVAVMLDTKGPEIRTGNTVDGKNVQYEKDAIVKVTSDYTVLGDPTTIACSYAQLSTTVKVGSIMFVADGSLSLEVTELGDKFVMARCLNAVSLGQKKNMNLPGAVVDLPTCTP
jgi:pyruvate kinase